MVAYYLFSTNTEGSTHDHLLPISGDIGKDMTAKLEMLFWTMHEYGASFSEPEENRLLKKVQRSVKERLNDSQRSAKEHNENENQYQHSRVYHMLNEKAL